MWKPYRESLHCNAFINQSRGDAPSVHEARSGLTDDWAILPLTRVDHDLELVGSSTAFEGGTYHQDRGIASQNFRCKQVGSQDGVTAYGTIVNTLTGISVNQTAQQGMRIKSIW